MINYVIFNYKYIKMFAFIFNLETIKITFL